MLKSLLLASAVAVSAPALAQVQDTAPPAGRTPTTVPAAPAQDAAVQPDAAVPADAAQATVPATPDPMTQATDPAQPAASMDAQAAQPAATTDQVAQAVDQGFPVYDKNGDGALDQTEFASWMTELRTASDPTVKADSPEMTTWAGQAFATADADKNAALTKGEVTAFLSQGAS